MTLLVLALYMAAMLALGYAAARYTQRGPADYYLAGRSLGLVAFPLTQFATLMSAFVFLGSGGWAYRHGFAWYPPIGIEAFLGVAMALVGYRAWILARQHGVLTPPELLGRLTGSEAVRVLVALVQLFWAVPYLSIQAVGGGHLLSALSGGAIPYGLGALLVTLLSAGYLLWGGLRAVAWTDVFQGLFIVVALLVAVPYVFHALPVAELTQKLARELPGMLQPQGAQGFFTPRMMFSFMLMNVLAVLAYPQLFQKYFAARSVEAFRALAVWWPPLTAVVALVPVLLGVWGRALWPDLRDVDQVIPRLVGTYAPAWVGGVLLGGALSAMMSTKDSILLTMASILDHDLLRRRAPGPERSLARARALTGLLLLASYLLALTRPPSIVGLAVYFIQGNALLAPAFLAALFGRVNAAGVLASVVVGQLSFAAAEAGLLPSFGFASFVPALVLSGLALWAGSYLGRPAPSPVAARGYGG